jgi:hypothetical protein
MLIAIFSCLLLISTIVYTTFSILQWSVMNRTFIAASKPSVGVEGIGVIYDEKDIAGNIISRRIPTETTTWLNISVQIKNFGSTTASGFTADWVMFIDGVPQKAYDEGQKDPPIEMFPGKTTLLIGAVAKDYKSVMAKKESLSLKITGSYDDPTKQNHRYTYCEEDHFEPDAFSFLFQGACK